MKKVISLLLVVVMICSTFAGLQITSSATDLPSSGSCGDNVTYTFDSSTGKLTISGSGAINDYSSSNSPFYNQVGIKTVVIENGVTSIGDYTFYYCSGLTSITIPDSVTSIGKYAFSDCSKLISITIPNSVTSIGSCAFYECTWLTSVTMPDSVTSIGDWAFKNCMNLKSITIPDSVTSIGSAAFYYCAKLTSITIPKSVIYIGNYAFNACIGLTNVTVDLGNTKYDSRNNCNAIIESSSNTLIAGCKNTVIPNSVKGIGSYAFCGCSGLTSTNIPYSVTSIGDHAFKNCMNLKSITIPDSVTSIGDFAFEGCSGLTSISIPDSVTYIGIGALSGTDYYKNALNWDDGFLYIGNHLISTNVDVSGEVIIKNGVSDIASNAFNACKKITKITLPESVEYIGDQSFSGCKSLESVKLPSKVAYIGELAFYECSALTKIVIPDGIIRIKSRSFYNCESLSEVRFPDTLTVIEDRAFYGCRNLSSISFPNNLTRIEGGAFTSAGINRVNIPDSVTFIGGSAFKFCDLTSIKMSDSIKTIGSFAFQANVFSSVTIPNQVETIDDYTFYECIKLKSVRIPKSVKHIGICAFMDTSNLSDIYYSGSQEDWNSIEINSSNNWDLRNVVIHYNCDEEPPFATIICSDTLDEKQILSLEMSDNAGLSGYYWGENSNYLKNSYYPITDNSHSICVKKEIKNAGTFYLTTIDVNGMVSNTKSINLCKTTLNANGGSVSPTSILTKKGSAFTFPTPTRSGYTYQGWSTSSSATSGVKSLTPNGDTTYYAVWKQNEVADTTKPTGSITSTNNVAASQTATLALSDNKDVAGYYWGTNSNYASNTYTTASAGNITKTISSAGTYYLTVKDTSGNLSEPVSITYYKTTLNANGGSVSPESVLTQSGKSFTFPTPTRNGYSYEGWSTSSDATSGVKSLSPTGNATYYAVWTENDTTKPTGNISSTNKAASSQTATLTLSDNKAVAGYYWGTDSRYASNTYTTASAGSVAKTVSAAGTYYLTVKDTAGNVSDTVSITYYKTILNANGGSVSPESVLTQSGKSFTFPTPTRSGYNYEGWSTSGSATSGIKSLTPSSSTTYYAVWKSENTSNPFTWGKDNWAFNNSSYSGYFQSGPVRNQINSTYLNVLKNNLTNSEYQCVFKGTSDSQAWLDRNWSGSCYGMSSTTLLSQAGLVPYLSYEYGANSLYQLKAPTVNGLSFPSASANVSSLITYYQMLQVKGVIQQQYRSVPNKTNKENITNLISLLDKNDVVLVGFKKDGWGGHAILAYGYEYGSYSKNGITYQGRIKICDPNHSVSNSDNYYIYFNTSSYNWTIPAYASSGIYSTKGAKFNYIGASVGDINKGGYLISNANSTTNSDDFIARLDAMEISDNRSIVKVTNNNGTYANHSSAPGEIVEDYSYIIGGESKGTIGYNLYDSESAYRVTQEDATDLSLTMDYENCLLSGSSKAGEEVIFDNDGFVSLTSESADYSIGMTFDDSHPTDWFAIEVSGENANQVSLEKEENGWIIEADNLQNVEVNTNNKSDEVTAYFSTQYDSALIYEIDANTIGIAVDTDDNGTYETGVATTDYRPYHMQYSAPSLAEINTSLTIKSNQYQYFTQSEDGIFELDSIHGDVYRVFAKQKNSLTVCIGEYDTANGAVTNDDDIFFPLGDVNSDDVIDFADISMLLSTTNYGQENSEIDLTGDGYIGIDDVAEVLKEQNYGMSSDIIIKA